MLWVFVQTIGCERHKQNKAVETIAVMCDVTRMMDDGPGCGMLDMNAMMAL